MLLGWERHLEGNVCVLKIRVVQGIQCTLFNGLQQSGTVTTRDWRNIGSGTISLLTSVRSKKRLRKMKAMFSQPTACSREKLQT